MTNLTTLKFKIDGFANLESVELDLGKFNALVALNNFGKSNLISSLDFGLDFIQMPISMKKNMMAYKPVIPINKTLANRPFSFEMEFSAKFKKENLVVNYGYSFDWIKNDKNKGQRVKSEFLKVKNNQADSKYKTYIDRNTKGNFYLSSQTGRCNKKISIDKEDLLINKLSNFDELFYLEIIKYINDFRVIVVETMRDPDKLFRTIGDKTVRTDYSLEIPRSTDVGFFIYSLMKKNQSLFSLYKDSVKSLLPSIEDFEPLEIDFKKQAKIESDDKIPIDFPEKLYDIIVKEKSNNQKTSIANISSGSQKIFFILAMAIAADLNKAPVIIFEEIENSIHPGLLQRLLIILDGLTSDTKTIVTSHSPYLIKYLDIDKIKLGIPNNFGTAQFKSLKKTKISKLLRIAKEDGVSIGDILFDSMIECSRGETEFLNDMCQ